MLTNDSNPDSQNKQQLPKAVFRVEMWKLEYKTWYEPWQDEMFSSIPVAFAYVAYIADVTVEAVAALVSGTIRASGQRFKLSDQWEVRITKGAVFDSVEQLDSFIDNNDAFDTFWGSDDEGGAK